jgi:hypothetical protein
MAVLVYGLPSTAVQLPSNDSPASVRSVELIVGSTHVVVFSSVTWMIACPVATPARKSFCISSAFNDFCGDTFKLVVASDEN